METLGPGFARDGIHGHDLVVGLLLDGGPLGGGEEPQGHDHISGDGVDSRRDHSQADGFELGVVEFGGGVFDDVAGDAGAVGAVGDAGFEHVKEGGEVFVAALAVGHGVGVLAGDQWEAEEGDVVLPLEIWVSTCERWSVTSAHIV